MEEQVRQDEPGQIRQPLKLDGARWRLHRDIARFRTFETLGVDRRYKVHGLLQTRVQFRETGFVIGIGGIFNATKTGSRTLGGIADQLDLLGEGLHVERQTRIQDGGVLDIFFLRPGLGLGENGFQVGERVRITGTLALYISI